MTGWALVRARARLADTAVAGSAVLLAMLCLLPLFDGPAWIPPAAGVVAVVGILGAASRAIALPLPLVPVVEGLGVLAYLTALYAGDQAWARILPTPHAWTLLRNLTAQGMVDAEEYAAPIATWPGVVLLAVGGVGVVALSTDSMFVSIRSPILAGLSLLALYLAPALVLGDGAPWWTFPLPAAGWLMILAADQRDRVRGWSGAPPTTRVRGLAGLALASGIVAILLAMVIAVVLPARTVAPPLATGKGPGVGAGASPVAVVLDPLVSMRRNLVMATDSEVLRYETTDPRPSYLRVTALEVFDGQTWAPRVGIAARRVGGILLPGDVQSRLTAADPTYHVRGGSSYTYGISVTSLQNPYLPLPYPVTDVSDVSGLGSDWHLDPDTGVAFSQGANATGLKYEVVALQPGLKPGELRDATVPTGQFWPQLALPSGLSPQVGRLARQAVAGADTSYDKALALQRWFTRDGGFRYSTSVRSGADADYLAEFLQDRVGYCEQFAATMAVMARTLGIPSRVAVGFTQGSRLTGDTWQVTVHDAHAWPELWFGGIGWVRFEPTPRADASVVAPDYAPAAPAPAVDPASPEDRALSRLEGFDRDVAGPLATGVPGPLVGIVLVGALAAGALLARPMVRRVLRRRRRLHARGSSDRATSYADMVNGAWDEVADTAVDLGQPWSLTSTPRQAAERLSRGMAAPAAGALGRIRSEVEQVRYANTAPALVAERSAAVRADVRTVRSELVGRVRWQTRLQAYCWPSSERRRQRSSMRSMNPGDLVARGAAGPVGAAPSAGRTWKDE